MTALCFRTTIKAGARRGLHYEALASKPGVQEVALALNPTTSVNKPRSDGFTETIAKNPNFKVVANISGLQTLEGGFKAAQAILAANPKVAAIYSMNDSMAAGAQQAIEQATAILLRIRYLLVLMAMRSRSS
jgi:ABC-type sugar transport system substrate-binding protein